METTNQIIRMNNFKLLNDILDKDFGEIECNCISDPNSEVFDVPIGENSLKISNLLNN